MAAPQSNAFVLVIQTSQDDVLVCLDSLRMRLEDLAHGQQPQILQILVRILDENTEFLNT